MYNPPNPEIPELLPEPMFNLGAMSPEAVVQLAEALPCDGMLLTELHTDLDRLIRTDFDTALVLVRHLIKSEQPNSRTAASICMDSLTIKYIDNYGHMSGLYVAWVDLLQDPDAAEITMMSFTSLIDSGKVKPVAISTLVSVLADRARGEDYGNEWETRVP